MNKFYLMLSAIFIAITLYSYSAKSGDVTPKLENIKPASLSSGTDNFEMGHHQHRDTPLRNNKEELDKFTKIYSDFSNSLAPIISKEPPIFAVYLTESGTLTEFVYVLGQGWQSYKHLASDKVNKKPGLNYKHDAYLIASDTIMNAILDGDITVTEARELGYLNADGPDSEQALAIYDELIFAYQHAAYE